VRSTLFHIPQQLFGYPLFGMGVLLAVWAVVSIAVLAWLIRKQGLNNDTVSYIPVLLLVGLTIRYLAPGISEEQGLPIRGYGVMLVVAVLSGVALGWVRAKRMGVSTEVILSLAFWLFVAGIVGGRMFYVVQNWDQIVDGGPAYAESLEPGDPLPTLSTRITRTVVAMISVNNGGLVVYGALIGGGLSLIAFVYRYRIPGLALADLIAPSVVLGMALGRIGCFLNGCCFGDVCDLPWAVTFPKQNPPHELSPAHEQQILMGQIYGLTIGADKKGAPIIADIRRDTPAAAAPGLKVTERVERIGAFATPTLDEAQRALMQTYKSGGPLELTIDGNIYRLPMLAGALDHSLPVHPSQIYSTIDALLLCLFLLAYYPYRRRDGELAALTMILHPISRYLIEIIRNDESPIFGTGLTISQNISLGILFLGVALWIYVSRKPLGTAWPTAASLAASGAAGGGVGRPIARPA
jgi:phosphatidylglycerol:prolipoprotein diacylglycerol transferase